ncbi:nitric oxide reductase activation protein NorD [Massilia sp. TSP1-1-2]|uniref:nitric oxide reductase activation protein NorD n=1 Tax=Massilia sp. TSP1-1-2 TaxID=2804649 RepID=UPI003CF231EB
MAEAEDVITDAARHATVFVRAMWQRHRASASASAPRPLALHDMAARLDLLASAVFGRNFTVRVAQTPAPPTWLNKLFLRGQAPAQGAALPCTDGYSIWLPASFGADLNDAVATQRYRVVMLQQAMRAVRGSALHCPFDASPLLQALFLVLEARAADDALVRLLPGMAAPLAATRARALRERPPLSAFAPALQVLERLVRAVLNAAPGAPLPSASVPGLDTGGLRLPATAGEVLDQARQLHRMLGASVGSVRGRVLFIDCWSGQLRAAPGAPAQTGLAEHAEDAAGGAPRAARLARRPTVRPPGEDEDEDGPPGPSMVQTAQPHEQAEDPMGLQRPTDRDATSAAQDFADSLAELPEARLVSSPAPPKEVLLSDDPPEAAVRQAGAGAGAAQADAEQRHYPEWDYRSQAYREPGATVLLSSAAPGPRQWVEQILAERGAMLREIRRRFELLRAQSTRLRKQLDGAEIDMQAWADSQADLRAGLPLAQRLYQSERRARRDMAVMLLVDVSGSTDGWIAQNRRVIDIEREALLLVCIALDGMDERFCVQAFSGQGPQGVVVRKIKDFGERYDSTVAQRIAGLEPEKYTRAGAAIRHASAVLMAEPAEHRLLLLLSDGKPNDVDEYEGRYGVEDMRQSVTEARLQGIAPFCLTVDRQAANYLPLVFGPQHYALLPRPELLPLILLDWLRKLMRP